MSIDMEEEIKRTAEALHFLRHSGMIHEYQNFISVTTKYPITHSDLWSKVYDWVHDGRFDGAKIPCGFETSLVQFYELDILYLIR